MDARDPERLELLNEALQSLLSVRFDSTPALGYAGTVLSQGNILAISQCYHIPTA
jgi:hypothetical protein